MHEALLKDFPEIVCDTASCEFPLLTVKTPLASAKISLYGGHVLAFTPAGEKPVLWMSGKSNFTAGKAIRGGVPVCWPWFGPGAEPGVPAHGFARISMWKPVNVKRLTGGAISITMRLTEKEVAAGFNAPPFVLELTVTISNALELQLAATNNSAVTQQYQAALHSYFAVGDATKITISKLASLHYFDKVLNCENTNSPNCDTLEIDREIDRVYLPASGSVAVADNAWRRTLIVEKSGSLSTVIWNPWIAKAKAMADFGDNEYMRMLCVECGNVLDDTRTLEPGETTVMTQKISVEKWD